MRPPEGVLKCNADVDIFKYHGKTGLGMCLRNHNGQFVQPCSQWMTPILLPHEGEALGLLHVVQWEINSGLSSVIFELDSSLVVEAVTKPKENFTESNKFFVILVKN